MSNFERKKSSSSCVGCMKAIKWIPVLFISSVIVWSYYAYVVQLCILSIENTFEKIIFLIFYHIICVLFFWSYWNTIFTPVGVIPAQWRIQDVDIDRLFHADSQEQQKRILENCSKNLPITNRTVSGSVRFCEKCKIIKPDRAHHCSVCGTCVLKMDHHCPWVNNCVNFYNYKFFVLFLGYALLYCLYVALTSLEYFIRFWKILSSQVNAIIKSIFLSQGDLNDGMGRFHILFLFFISLMFAISLVSLFGYHIYLVVMNRTTLESFRAPIFRIGGPDKNGFNLGKYNNFQEVFGDNWKLWLVPVYTSLGNGLEYRTSPQQQQRSLQEYNVRQYRASPPLPTLYNQQLQPLNYDSMGATPNRLDLIEQTDQLIACNNEQRQQQQQLSSSSSPQSSEPQEKQQQFDENDVVASSTNIAKFSETGNNQKSNHNESIINVLDKNSPEVNAIGSPNKLCSVNANGNVIVDMSTETKNERNDKKIDAHT